MLRNALAWAQQACLNTDDVASSFRSMDLDNDGALSEAEISGFGEIVQTGDALPCPDGVPGPLPDLGDGRSGRLLIIHDSMLLQKQEKLNGQACVPTQQVEILQRFAEAQQLTLHQALDWAAAACLDEAAMVTSFRQRDANGDGMLSLDELSGGRVGAVQRHSQLRGAS